MAGEIVIVGGGFYGCCIALYMRSVTDRIILIEAGHDLLTRASLVNQARVHTGFHYPRSLVTATRSLSLYKRFIDDFRPAVEDNFKMLYAIARTGSKVSARRFLAMFGAMGAPLAFASTMQKAMFSAATIQDVFACDEYAFNANTLREFLRDRLDRAGVKTQLGRRAIGVQADGDAALVSIEDGTTIPCEFVFNATYSRLNYLNIEGEKSAIPIKSELSEIAIIEPPTGLSGLGVTVMDGPFFSTMPHPVLDAYSLTHVKYTPQLSWVEDSEIARGSSPVPFTPQTRWLHMKRDAERYLPLAADFRWRTSLFEVKSVLVKNEIDDGRPILLHRHQQAPKVFSVLGGKLDNIYDLAEILALIQPQWSGLNMGWFKAS